MWFLALDGDDIGRGLEFHIVNNDIEGLREFASLFSDTSERMLKCLSDISRVDTILHEGDSLLISIPASTMPRALQLLREEIRHSEFTFSGGYGPSLRSAYLALKIAKAGGKNSILSAEALQDD